MRRPSSASATPLNTTVNIRILLDSQIIVVSIEGCTSILDALRNILELNIIRTLKDIHK